MLRATQVLKFKLAEKASSGLAALIQKSTQHLPGRCSAGAASSRPKVKIMTRYSNVRRHCWLNL